MTNQTFNKILQERLEGENLSSLSRELGINKAVLFDWVKSNRLPSMKNIDHVARLARYLGLSLEELLLGPSSNKETSHKVITKVSFKDGDREYEVEIKRKNRKNYE